MFKEETTEEPTDRHEKVIDEVDMGGNNTRNSSFKHKIWVHSLIGNGLSLQGMIQFLERNRLMQP